MEPGLCGFGSAVPTGRQPEPDELPQPQDIVGQVHQAHSRRDALQADIAEVRSADTVFNQREHIPDLQASPCDTTHIAP